MFEALYVKVVFVITAVAAVAGMNYAFKWKNDNKVEQVVEKIVENETGFVVDLTPFDNSSINGDDGKKTFDLDKAMEEAKK